MPLTSNYGLFYPAPNEDFDVPDDMMKLASSVDSVFVSINNRIDDVQGSGLVTGVTLQSAVGNEENSASISNGHLTLRLKPAGLETLAGATLQGNLSINGQLTIQQPSTANHAVNKGYVDSLVPVGIIMPWAGSDIDGPGNGWLVCDGRNIPSNYTQLRALLGNATTTPNLQSRFLYGWNGVGTVRNNVGSSTITLNQSNLPSHSHEIGTSAMPHVHSATVENVLDVSGNVISNKTATANTGGTNIDHLHTGQTGFVHAGYPSAQSHTHTTDSGTDHRHGMSYGNNWQGSDMAQNPSGTDYMPIGQSPPGHRGTDGGPHTHGMNWVDTNHVHDFSTAGMNSNIVHSHTVSMTTDITHRHSIAVGQPRVSISDSATPLHSHSCGSTGSGTPINMIPSAYTVMYIIYGGVVT